MAPVDTALHLYWAMVAVFMATLAYTVINFPAPEFSPAPVIQCKPWSPLRPNCEGGCNLEFALRLPALRCVAAPRQEKKKVSGGGGVRKAEGLVSGSSRSAANCLAAADIFEAASEAESGKAAADLQLKAADALTCAMRINGDGNLVLIDGVLDTPSNKQYWGTHGPRALALARAATSHASLSANARAAATEMDAFMYAAASKGILQQAFTGTGAEFRKKSERLVEKHTSWDSAAAHVYLGGFYLVAPWPLGDKKRAVSEYQRAVDLAPTSKRNLYYLCLAAMQTQQPERAASACAAAAHAKCRGPTEPDYCARIDKETQRVLAMATAAA